MDWRARKYYVANFSPEAYDMRVKIFKNIDGIKLHNPTKHNFNIKLPDEKEPRGNYHVLIGCNFNIKDIVEFELRKAERLDEYSRWEEIHRDTSKKYYDLFGLPYRKCDLTPRKRCNHCMDC